MARARVQKVPYFPPVDLDQLVDEGTPAQRACARAIIAAGEAWIAAGFRLILCPDWVAAFKMAIAAAEGEGSRVRRVHADVRVDTEGVPDGGAFLSAIGRDVRVSALLRAVG